MKDIDSSLKDIGVHPSLFGVSIPVVKLVVAFLAPFGTVTTCTSGSGSGTWWNPTGE